MKVSFRKIDKNVIARIRREDDRVMESVYFKYREEFLVWSTKKFGISQEDALDHYQDTLTIFFEKVINGSIESLESSLKTYLFGIGKNRVMQQLDQQGRREKHEVGLAEHYRFLAEDEASMNVFDDARDRAKELISSIGETCREILKLFYFEKRSMKEIAKIMGHKSEAVSRTTKKRCLEKIRTQVSDQ